MIIICCSQYFYKKLLRLKHDHIIIAGDFNLKQIDWESRQVNGSQDSYQYKVFDTVNDLFLTETVQEPTRFRGSDQPSKLDWVLTENVTCISNMMVNPPLGLSDHSLLSFDYYCFTEKYSTGYSYFNGKYESMREELDSPEWIEGILSLNAQESWNNISNKITGLIKRYIPQKKYTHKRSPPWFNREIAAMCKNKHKTWIK